MIEVRRRSVPTISYPPDLPVSVRADELVELIREHQVLVVCGETGSGKSTQLPKICLAAGRGVNGFIGHTQPRRLAARAIASRLAEEMGTTVGDLVGFTVRFTDATKPETLVKVMTDGILLAEIPGDRTLSAYDTIIIDEAHERGLNIDFLLGYLRTLLPRRPDLKLIITSATIDPERFSRHFSDAPIVEVSGRTYPVEMRYRPIGGRTVADAGAASGGSGGGGAASPSDAKRGRGGGRGPSGRPGPGAAPRRRRGADLEADGPDPAAYEQPIVDAVRELLQSRDAGDVLVFLPGEREIRDATRALRGALGIGHGHSAGRAPDGTLLEILPLYARLSVAEQQRVFRQHPGRRIVLATNVAETSITVPGIRSVVDTGLARISRYGVRTKVEQLPIEAISRASAAQRAGRCGRIAPGICIRLFSEEDFEQREEFTPPEIRRTNLAGVILRMRSMRLGDPLDFPFVEPPRRAAVRDGLDTLYELGALDAREELTELGRRLGRLPVDPRLARILMAGLDEDCFPEASILAAALAVPDPRERPAEARDAADQAHRRFRDESSDFLSLLNVWDAFERERIGGSSSALRRWCTKHFLSWVRMREWRDLHRQLVGMVPDARHTRRRDGGSGGGERTSDDRAPADAIHRAVLSGLLSNVGVRDEETGTWRGVRGGEFVIHPSSTLHRTSPEWVMAAEIVETTRRYARTVAAIQPRWLEDVAGHLLKARHGDPRWDRATGRVMCTERHTLFGRELGRGRATDFGPVDAAKAREMFIHHALVERDFDCGKDFFAHNGRLLEEIAELERRQRRHDVLADHHLQFAFYEQRLPRDVYDARSLEQWLLKAERDGARPLHMSLDDLVIRRHEDGGDDAGGRGSALDVGGADAGAVTGLAAAAGLVGLDPDAYPDHLSVGGSPLPLQYRNEPGAEDDGVSLTVPVGLLGQISARRVQWLVPGRLEELVLAIIRAMPKQWRRNFVPAGDVARDIAASLPFGDGDVREVVAAALTERAGFDVPPSVLDLDRLPDDLRMRICVIGDGGRTLGAGRDLGRLVATHVGSARDALARAADERWSRDGLTAWDVGEVPERIELSLGGMPVYGYPAIVDAGRTAALRLLESSGAADRAHRLGVRRLLLLACRSELRAQLEWVPDIETMRLRAHALPTPPPPAAGAAASRSDFNAAFMLLVCERAFLTDAAGTPVPLPRNEAGFTQLLDGGWGRLTEAAAEVGQVLHALLGWYAHVGEVLAAHATPAFATINADERGHLARLVPADVLASTPWPRLTQVPRYLAGIAKRYERLRTIGPERDAERGREVQAWEHAVLTRLHAEAERGRHDPRLENLRWTLEEFRISQFAQDLGTAEPVSIARLTRVWQEIMADAAAD